MTIDTIVPDKLWAVRYDEDNDNALVKTISSMLDPENRLRFFEDNKKDLEYYKLTVEEAVEQTMNELLEIVDYLYVRTDRIEDFFHSLNDAETNQGSRPLPQSKGYIPQSMGKGLLRIYAIKLEPNYYVVTGGAIKLTRAMQDRPHTYQELVNLGKCRDFLIQQGVIDKDSFIDSEIINSNK